MFGSIALVVLVFRRTGSGLDVGVVTIVQIVPLIVFGFFAGALVDRLRKVKVKVVSDLGRGLLALSLVVVRDQLGPLTPSPSAWPPSRRSSPLLPSA